MNPHLPSRPLADLLRPSRLEDIVGQDHLLGPDAPIGRMIARNLPTSMVLWGAPGCGKTTIAHLLKNCEGTAFEQLSAMAAGVSDLKSVFVRAAQRAEGGITSLLFVDELHRFNRTQQDVLLPVVENGQIILVGATTENPGFALSGALLSRLQVFQLRRLDEKALSALISRAETRFGRALPVDDGARAALITMSDGDGRALLGFVQMVF
ncbi:MAG: AAA family ATPase, partial [Pseudomonadota bacterium]